MSGLNTDYKDLHTILEENPDLKTFIFSHEVSFDKGAYIYLPEDRPDMVFYILKGKVKVGSFFGDDKDVVQDILVEGDIFNESAMSNTGSKNEYAYAMENVKLAGITHDKMTEIFARFPSFNMYMMKVISEKIDEKQNRLESLIFKNSRTRIIEFLINNIHKKGQRIGYEWLLRHFYTHQDIASLTSTSRQSVTTILNELRTKNILQFDRKRMLVRDLEQLKAQIEL
ncbi:MAG: Crp/Fnr family transcriptional regulator [Chitinophagales bacterium]|nr:Crp/Fnr family transcriptional regulator [Chitinophagales bacterium]